MKFTTNTRPLIEALNLGIIDSNITNFYKRSCITQLTATADALIVNIESSMICTEIRLNGVGEGDGVATAFVDSSLFKKLVNTLESNVCIEFDSNGIKLQSGRSKFSLGNSIADAVDISDFSLKSPKLPEADVEFVNISKEDWKFIKDNQTYAVSSSFTHPVYTKIWVGEDGDVLTGDYDISLYTHSKHGTLGTSCLLSDTIINLLNSLPETAQIAKVDNDYVVKFAKDAYTYVTQFTPQYESEEDVGSYRSDIFLSKMVHPEKSNKVSTKLVVKLLNQALLLAPSNGDVIKITVNGNSMSVINSNVNGQIELEGDTNDLNYTINFRLDLLKQVISNYGDMFINISPLYDGETPVGIIVWNDDLTTILAGVE